MVTSGHGTFGSFAASNLFGSITLGTGLLNQGSGCSPTLLYLEESMKLLKDSKSGNKSQPGNPSGNLNTLISQSISEQSDTLALDAQALIEIYARKKGRKPNYLKALL